MGKRERGGRRSEEGGERGGGRKEKGRSCNKDTIWTCLVWFLLEVIMGETHMAGSEGRESCVDKGCIHQ